MKKCRYNLDIGGKRFMKHFKRLFSYLVALTMVLSLAAFAGVNVHADTGNSLTITNNGKTAHTFELYQIFTGTQKDKTDSTLGDIEWGSGVTDAGRNQLGNAAENAKKLNNDSAKARTLAKTLDKNRYLQNPTYSKDSSGEKFAVPKDEKYTFGNLETGYYLVKDEANTQTGENSAYTDYICCVVGKTEAETKLDVPTTIKKVQENKKDVNKDDLETDANMNDVKLGNHFNDVADYSIGDNIPYELIGSLPTNYDKYTDGYFYQFTDIMDKGLTRNDDVNDDVQAWISNDDGSSWTKIYSGFNVSPVSKDASTGKTTFTVTFDNLKNAKDKDGSVITTDSNSKIKVTFTAKLNGDAEYGNPGNVNESYLKYSNDVNGEGKGETTHDKVVVFTYELDSTKVDANETTTKLEGAEFILADSNGEGKKYLVQTKDKEGKVTNNTWTTDENEATKFVSGSDGKFEIKGLDDGTYYLQETKAPEGYNIDSTLKKVTINATTSNGQDWNGSAEALTALSLGKLNNSGDKEKGTVSEQITNTKGSSLPSTGGMGTTLLYVAGGILVACAAAYVIISRKKSAKK